MPTVFEVPDSTAAACAPSFFDNAVEETDFFFTTPTAPLLVDCCAPTISTGELPDPTDDRRGRRVGVATTRR